MLTPDECSAARNLLRWARIRLASRIGVSETTLVRFELKGRQSRPLDLARLRAVFEAEGVEFVAEDGAGAGVRLKKGRRER